MRYKRLPAVRTEKKRKKEKESIYTGGKYTRHASRKTEKEEGRRDSLRRVVARETGGTLLFLPSSRGLCACVRAALLPPPSPHSYPLRRSPPGSYEAVEGCVRVTHAFTRVVTLAFRRSVRAHVRRRDLTLISSVSIYIRLDRARITCRRSVR